MPVLHAARRRSASVLVASGLIAAPCAMAQNATPDATTLDRIVVVADRAVTATKTDTPLVETPQAISVVPSALFTERGAVNVQETLRYSAGVTAEAFGLDTRGDGSTVRGLDPVQYLDGMRRIYTFTPVPRTEVYSLDRIEVLRGPSSVLYGAGGSGGIINSFSKRPQFKPAGELAVQLGSFDRRQVQGDVTGTLDDAGTLAGRFVSVYRDSGMQTDAIDDDRVFLSPSLTWRPNDRSTLTFIAAYQRDESASSQQFLPVVASLRAPPGRRLDPSVFLGDTDYDRLDAEQSSATVLGEFRLGDALTLRNSLRYVDAKTTFQEIYPDVYSNPTDPFIDADRRVVNRFAYGIKPDFRVLTSDNSLQVDVAAGPFTHALLGGIDYTDFCESSQTAFGTTDDGTVPPIDIDDPVSTGVIAPAYFRDPDQHTSQLGVYVQDQIRYGDRVSLLLGARRDRARSDVQGSPLQTDHATTYRVGLIGEVVEGVSPYVSYSESFLPVQGLDFFGTALVPVRGRQTEGGIKWTPSRDALLTASVYRITESNRVTNDPDNVLNIVQTGEVRSRGIELEGNVALADDLIVTAAWSYNDAEVTRSNFAREVGERLSDTPQRLASVWIAKTHALGSDTRLRVGVGGRYVGPTQSITGEQPLLVTPSYTLADALVAVDWSRWSLSVNATNLFDKRYFAPCRGFGDCFTGNTRSVIGTLAYRF